MEELAARFERELTGAYARSGVSFRAPLRSPVKGRSAHQALRELGALLGLKQRQSWPTLRLSV